MSEAKKKLIGQSSAKNVNVDVTTPASAIPPSAIIPSEKKIRHIVFILAMVLVQVTRPFLGRPVGLFKVLFKTR